MTTTAGVSGKSRKAQPTRYQMYIDGKFVDGGTGQTFEVYDLSLIHI